MSKEITTAEAQEILQESAPKQRFVGIDIVKILAALLVVSIHFFLYSGFYGEPIDEASEMIPIMFRWLTYSCVPIFMITTGYLMKNKTISKKYYLGLVKIIAVYLVMSVLCAIFDHLHYGKEFTPWTFVRGLFMFSDAPYSWYVEYHICILLLAPFINLAFNGLKNKKHQLTLVVTALALTAFGRSFFVGFERDIQIQIFPDYFSGSYGIAYYLAGAYIRQNPPKRTIMNKILYLMGMALALGWNTVTTYYHSTLNVEGNYAFSSWHYNDYGTWPVFLVSLFIFLLLFDISSKNKIVIKVLQVLGEATLGCYLISYVFDNSQYSEFCGIYPTMAERLTHAPLIIGKNFLASMGVALVVHNLYNLIAWLIRKINQSRKDKKAAALEAAEGVETEAEPAMASAAEQE
ncbi:MAG: acyltransferase [Ruminococcus sp.]|nr:acyltransferase [Ruminococcus sp.]